MLGILEAIVVGAAIYSITALGVFITFRILDFPDLTVEGSFPLGAVVMGISLAAGLPLWSGFFLAVVCGVVAGVCTALIHNYLKVPGLLAGILTMMILYSVNIRILGRPNLSLLNVETQPIFSRLREFAVLQLHSLDPLAAQAVLLVSSAILFMAVLLVVLDLFFLTDLGIALGAMGGNQQMVVSYGLNPRLLKGIGLGISNGLVALSGAFLAQYQGFADVGLGTGIIITGLAIVMMGEFCIHSNRIYWITLRILLGALLYQALIYLARRYGASIGFLATDIKLMTGLLIVVFLSFSQIQKRRTQGQALKRAVVQLKSHLKITEPKVEAAEATTHSATGEVSQGKGEWL